eukprot:g7357.t1
MQIPSSFRRWISEVPGTSFRGAAQLVTVPMPTLRPDQALVRTKYATINGGHDTFVARRDYLFDSITGTCNLGADCLGRVLSVGSDVQSLKVGDYVTAMGSGGYSEFTTPLESSCSRIDSPELEYAALRVNGTMICGALEITHELIPGTTMLVTAAAGGVGHLAVQLGKLHGCHVIGTCGGSRKKGIVLSLGANRVIDYREESVNEVLKKEYPDGIDYVVEGVGGKLLKTAYENLAPNGTIISVGHISQYPHAAERDQDWDFELGTGYPTLRQFLKGRKNLSIGDKLLVKEFWPKDPKDRSHCRTRAFRLFKEQKWKVLIDDYALSTFVGLESIPDSVDYMLSGKSVGKFSCVQFHAIEPVMNEVNSTAVFELENSAPTHSFVSKLKFHWPKISTEQLTVAVQILTAVVALYVFLALLFTGLLIATIEIRQEEWIELPEDYFGSFSKVERPLVDLTGNQRTRELVPSTPDTPGESVDWFYNRPEGCKVASNGETLNCEDDGNWVLFPWVQANAGRLESVMDCQGRNTTSILVNGEIGDTEGALAEDEGESEGITVSRVLLARASATSSATATANGQGGDSEAVASAVSNAVATGDSEAISEAISNANAQQGSATANAIAEAITEALDNGAPRDAVATAIADATALELDAVNGYLDRQDTEALAEAIATSSGGTSYAESTSVAEAVARQRNVVIRAIVRVFDFVNSGGSAYAAARRSASAIGETIAEAYADTSVILEVTGTGTASGNAEANVVAVADAFAQVILEGIVQACNKYSKAQASFEGEAISTAIAEASARAFSQAEIRGPGYAEAIQNSVARAVVNPIATVLVDAVAYAYGSSSSSSSVVLEANSGVGNEYASANSAGSSAVEGSGSADVYGGADAYTEQASQCRGSALRCCRTNAVYEQQCGCRRGRCRYESIQQRRGKTVLWKHTYSGRICQC